MTAFHDIGEVLKAGYLFPESYCLRIERMLSVVLGLLRLSLKELYIESCFLSTSYISRIITYLIVSRWYVAVTFEVGRVNSKINAVTSNNVCAAIKKRVCLSIYAYIKIGVTMSTIIPAVSDSTSMVLELLSNCLSITNIAN
jgi:hypothetical protein